jgi:hypothetical protein
MTTGVAEVAPDHFSARAEPGFRRDQRSIAAKRLVPRKNIEFHGTKRRCCCVVTVADHLCSGFAAKQPN